MSEIQRYSLETQNTGTLSPNEIHTIEAIADIRRRRIQFNASVRALEAPEEGAGRQRYDAVLEQVMRVSGGEFLDAPTSNPLEKAEEYKEIAKRAQTAQEAALNFAKAAHYLHLASDSSFAELLERAKATTSNIPSEARSHPTNLLPDAYLLGIEGIIARASDVPSPERVAQHALSDKSITKDYALVLEEDQRDEFLQALPDDQRKRASAALDRWASEVLKQSTIATEEEKGQRSRVQERAAGDLLTALTLPAEGETKAMVKELAQTLKEIEGDDSKRLLEELGERGLASSKDKEKHRRRISHAARVIVELSRIDQAKGASLAMKFLGKKEVPIRLFSFFLENLIESGFVTKNTEKHLSDPKHVPFLRKLIAEYPNQFNTAIDTLADQKFKDYDVLENQTEVFQALRDLDAITPIIFNRYRKADVKGKRALAEQIRDLKPKFFRNLSIGDILLPKDQDILVEMVYLAYKPINMSFEAVKDFIGKLEDHTEDLENYNFPEEGYPFEARSMKTYRIKPHEKLDMRALRTGAVLFSREYPQSDEEVKAFSEDLERLVKGDTDFKPEEISRLLSVMGRHQMVVNFREEFRDVSDENAFSFLSGLKERLGVFYDDNYWQALNNFLREKPDIDNKIQKMLANPKRIETIIRKLGKKDEDIDVGDRSTREGRARLLALFISSKVMKGIKEEMAKQANKFEESEEGVSAERTHANLRAYISKNIGSFFAKASAGICTAEDIELFEREDHFHINIVENDERVRGNIQAYIIKDQGKKSLVLRGFNPNEDFLKSIDPAAFCETVLSIARKFQEENGLRAVYITESLGGWHALSNRDKVQEYLVKKYCKEKKQKSFHLKIASGQSVNSIYEV